MAKSDTSNIINNQEYKKYIYFSAKQDKEHNLPPQYVGSQNLSLLATLSMVDHMSL